ncbi:MAG: cation-translocating P-type ATPase [Isosphaeraceae bacterium]
MSEGESARTGLRADLEKPEDTAWHALPAEEAAARLGGDPRRGLSQVEASRRLARFGPNRLEAEPGRSAAAIFLAQFRSLVVGLLVVATGVAFAMGEHVEAGAILVVVVLNALIGFLTEWKAEHAIQALRRQAVPEAHVVRDGVGRSLAASGLVPGDLVVLDAGSKVPADGRVVEGVRLRVDEAVLTGESVAASKSAEPVTDAGASLGDRSSMVYMGTNVADGRGRFLVTATGMATELGKIDVLLEEAGAHSTPLERKLAELGRSLVVIVLGLCGVIVAAGWLRGYPFPVVLEVGISLAIAAVPEGLPAVATMTLAIGVQRMARVRAVVRRLPAVEALGAVTVICTDKTGTLTRNEMTVQTLWLDGRRVDVDGVGYHSHGAFTEAGTLVDPQIDPSLALALRAGALCNDARVDRADGREVILGDPTEAALVVAAEKGGLDPRGLRRDFPREAEIPFDSVSKRMTTVHRTESGGRVAFVKGSPGTLLQASRFHTRGGTAVPLGPEDRERVEEANRALAGEALRVLGLAYRELPGGDGWSAEDLDRDLVFLGLVGMIDPLRDEARAAILACREAGIRTVMITGDQPPTAAEIARQLGIDRDASGRPMRTLHARELDGLDQAGWDRAVAETSVFARVSPRHKLQIVEALERRGEVVAMTGDGVNDAPALKAADLGVAMGVKGTEVAKEAADMVLTDDNFATLVAAVEQGRIVYANILRFIHYLFSCNLAEVLTVFVTLMLGWPMPLGALQILWLNMVTDVFPALALALEPSAPGMMKRPPRDPGENLLNPRFLRLIFWHGLVVAGATLAAFVTGLRWHGNEGDGLRRAMTLAFMTLALAQVAHAFNARSQRRSALADRPFSNGWLWAAVLACVALQALAVSLPLLREVLQTVPPTPAEWGLIAACSLAPLALEEAAKALRRGGRGRVNF